MDDRISRIPPAPGTPALGPAGRIRWNDAPSGSTGQFGPFTFIVSRIYSGGGEYLLVPYVPGMGDRRAGGSLDDVKAVAETWLREFISSLGALFAADLRAWLEERAAVHQELGDDKAESPGVLASEQAHRAWGRAEAFRETVKHLEEER
jgi:hypothetical protein